MSHLVVSNRKIANAHYFSSPEILNDFLAEHPCFDTLLFPFWSWIVKPEMLGRYRCIGFHTGPLLEGKGRGGSPIDNLKKIGVTITTLCAFEMNSAIDGGRVLLAVPIKLDKPKEWIIDDIDKKLPLMIEYLTTKQPEIPGVFKRV